jgi:hypothetical protein
MNALPGFGWTGLEIGIVFALGTLIGAQRQSPQRSAGLRTTVQIAVGAAAFSDLGIRLHGSEGQQKIVAYVVSGIGFLGNGIILKDGTSIRGLNTAGTSWRAARPALPEVIAIAWSSLLDPCSSSSASASVSNVGLHIVMAPSFSIYVGL